MTTAPSSAEDALQRIDTDIAEAQERAEQATAYRQETAALRGSGTVDGVTVTVDSTGRLVDVDIARLHDGQSATALGATIVRANAQAQRDVSTRLRAAAEASFGDSATTRHIEREIDQHFGAAADGGR